MASKIVAPMTAQPTTALDTKGASQHADEPGVTGEGRGIELVCEDGQQARQVATAHVGLRGRSWGRGTAGRCAAAHGMGAAPCRQMGVLWHDRTRPCWGTGQGSHADRLAGIS